MPSKEREMVLNRYLGMLRRQIKSYAITPPTGSNTSN